MMTVRNYSAATPEVTTTKSSAAVIIGIKIGGCGSLSPLLSSRALASVAACYGSVRGRRVACGNGNDGGIRRRHAAATATMAACDGGGGVLQRCAAACGGVQRWQRRGAACKGGGGVRQRAAAACGGGVRRRRHEVDEEKQWPCASCED
jgi:hypothetical protein